MGHDDILCYFIKLSSSVFTPVLSTSVNLAITLDIFSKTLKLLNLKIYSLFKKGDKFDVNIMQMAVPGRRKRERPKMMEMAVLIIKMMEMAVLINMMEQIR